MPIALADVCDREVYPGDLICAVSALDQVVLGPGVAREGERLLATCVGRARWVAHRRRLWVEGEAGRYVPAVGDHVIGIVAEKHAEEYRLQLGSAALGSLPVAVRLMVPPSGTGHEGRGCLRTHTHRARAS